ncbi:MAG: sensor histidine kinase [Phycisphaerales bacterium JB043]
MGDHQNTDQVQTLASVLSQMDAMGARLDLLDRAVTRNQRLATLGTLSAGVAHELNNILTPPANYARLALKDPENHELVQQALERIIQSCDRAGRVVEAVLGYSRERGEADECLVADAVSVVCDCAQVHEHWKGTRVEVDVDPSLRVAMGQGDLEQVLLNLVLNALEALGRNGRDQERVLRITGKCSTWNTLSSVGEDPSALVGEICVEDSGPGVAPEQRERIFEAFVSIGESNSPKQGTGLGLAICRQLVEQTGGEMGVGESELGGALFTTVLRTTIY